MSVIVCGLGQVGVRVAVLLLNLGQQVKVITTDALPEFQKLVEDAGGEIIKADARDSAELVRAGIGEA
jgi:Trk K+ transport system NAD-binding subunit